jgi:hypothetical protein
MCFECSIVMDARRRFSQETKVSWEDFLRAAYIREARLRDALIVDLATGDPLTEDEVAGIDPYRLAVMYEDGSLSKDWGKAPTVKQSSCCFTGSPADLRTPEADAARWLQMIETLHDTMKPCRRCNSYRRWKSPEGGTTCFDCSLGAMERRGFVVPSEGV